MAAMVDRRIPSAEPGKSARHLLTLREVQLAELKMLEKVDSFCLQNELRYTLIGGTLLGAIRHKGFIPWDDDIDIGMPRPDFERFAELQAQFEKDTGLVMYPYFGVEPGGLPIIKVSDCGIWTKPTSEIAECPLWIDVAAIDALPQDEAERKVLYGKLHRWRSLLCNTNSEPASGRSLPRKVAKLLFTPFKHSSRFKSMCISKVNQLAGQLPYGSTDYVGVLGWGLYGAGECMLKSEFDRETTVEFEGNNFRAMSCWDLYLTGLYGDYMKLPPEDKRHIHGVQAWRLEADVPSHETTCESSREEGSHE